MQRSERPRSPPGPPAPAHRGAVGRRTRASGARTPRRRADPFLRRAPRTDSRPAGTLPTLAESRPGRRPSHPLPPPRLRLRPLYFIRTFAASSNPSHRTHSDKSLRKSHDLRDSPQNSHPVSIQTGTSPSLNAGPRARPRGPPPPGPPRPRARPKEGKRNAETTAKPLAAQPRKKK